MFRNSLFLFIAKDIEKIGDPNGSPPTIYGITKTFYPKDYEKLEALLKKHAPQKEIDDAIIEIYEKIYMKSKADKMFYPLNWLYFDFYFHRGPKRAGRILEITINQVLKTDAVTVDNGVVGPEVLGALKEIEPDKDKREKLCSLYTVRRLLYYSSLGSENIHGYAARVCKLISYMSGLNYKLCDRVI